jgi:hypothetical protein
MRARARHAPRGARAGLLALVLMSPCALPGADAAPNPPPAPVAAPAQGPGAVQGAQAPGAVVAAQGAKDGDDAPAQAPPVMKALPPGWSAAPSNVDTVVPGRESPATAAHECVIRVAWNNYHTLIVVAPGQGVLRPGFVLTYQDSGDLQVAYRAAVYRDRHGVLHADARGAMIVGPSAASWSPDSFAIFASGLVVTLDDHGSSERGMVTRSVALGEKDYQPMLLSAESIVDDGI